MFKPKNSNTFMLILIVASVVIPTILGIGLEIFTLLNPQVNMHFPTWAVILFGQLIIFGLPSIAYLSLHKDKIREILPLRRLGAKNIIMIIAMSVAIQPLFMLVNLLSQFFFPNVIGEAIQDIGQEGGIALTLAIVAVVPSVFEEVAFRGIGFAGYKNVKIRTAAIINGLVFGIIHMNMNQFFYAFLLGAVFCYFMYYTKSLWAPILSHFIINSTQSLIAYGAGALVDPEAVEYAVDMDLSAGGAEFMLLLAIIAVFAIIFTCAFFAIYIAFKRHNLKRNEQDGIITHSSKIETEEEPRPIKGLTWHIWVIVCIFAVMMVLRYAL